MLKKPKHLGLANNSNYEIESSSEDFVFFLIFVHLHISWLFVHILYKIVILK